jgi:RNA polymerase sigma-70 factor (ECF subfamily)
MTDFAEVYRAHFADVYKYVLSLCRDPGVAEEITQETFFKALRSIDQYRGQCKLYVWLCQIARNTYFTFREKQAKSASPLDDNYVASGESLETALTNKDQAQIIHTHLHRMADPYKEVFTLRVFGELSFIQIGQLFDKTDGWARLVYYRAKKQLLEAMQ